MNPALEEFKALVRKEAIEEITAKVTEEITAKVTEEVTAKVTKEVTAKVTKEITEKIKEKQALALLNDADNNLTVEQISRYSQLSIDQVLKLQTACKL